MQLAFVGTGYVGLVSGTCFAESGNNVTCVDIDAEKVKRLRDGIIPIYEPGLTELVQSNVQADRLAFTTDLNEALAKAQLVFVAVGTPQGNDGSANLSAIWSVVDEIREKATDSKIVVIKSTVPVGTNAKAMARLNEGSKIPHESASNPEFLKEGYAVDDFMKPDRVVVGVRSQRAEKLLKTLHEPFLRTNHPFLVMSPESAEMTKYVANCMLATKISFINEMANLCETMKADINDVRIGIGHDSRIGFQFLFPGVGYGGSCFPKDVRAMISLAKQHGIRSRILESVDDVNEAQKTRIGMKVRELLGSNLQGKTVALWGLSFKPRTDDIREAPSLVLIRELLEGGAEVRVHDPKAIGNVKQEFGDRIVYCDKAYGTVEGADLLAIVTEWQEFRNPDFEIIRRLMNRPIIVDGRNLYDPATMQSLGFTYSSIGRATVVQG
jgi:UDPglucose 6-dehydrogenase